jgi:signal transduction histidine kinase
MSSLRTRLTVVFGLMFFAAALVALAGTMILVQHSLQYGLDIAYASGSGADPAGVAGSKRGILQSMQVNLLAKGGLTVLAVGIVATTAGWLVAGRLLRPLRRITATAQRIAGRTLHRRIGLDAPPSEVKTLADAFDSMLDRLDEAFAGQSRFISNAAHELKTPLVLNRTLVEVAMARRNCPPELRQLGENLLAVNARHERLIDALLTLARAENAMTERLPVDLAELARSVLGTVVEGADDKEVTLAAELAPAPTVGDPLLLEQVIRNLVDNAVAYNRSGGWVRVCTRPLPGGVELTVANTGATVSPHEVPALFAPFRRLTSRVGSARGSGLGLSIVRAVANAHGGDADAVPRSEGGLTVRVTLPAPRESPGRQNLRQNLR